MHKSYCVIVQLWAISLGKIMCTAAEWLFQNNKAYRYMSEDGRCAANCVILPLTMLLSSLLGKDGTVGGGRARRNTQW
jgi:hypothetical protein